LKIYEKKVPLPLISKIVNEKRVGGIERRICCLMPKKSSDRGGAGIRRSKKNKNQRSEEKKTLINIRRPPGKTKGGTSYGNASIRRRLIGVLGDPENPKH